MNNDRLIMDEKLIEAVKQFQDGDDTSFQAIYDNSVRYVYYSISMSMQDKDLAEDILQETYLEIYKNLKSLKEPEAFKKWAVVIAHNKINRYYRKNKDSIFPTEEELETAIGNEEEQSTDMLPEDAMDNQETQRLIMEIIRNLPEIQRETIISYYYNQMSVSEISEALNIPENTTKTNLSRGRKRIKDGVIELEKKHGTKLYSIPLAIVLAGIFTKETAASEIPETGLSLVQSKDGITTVSNSVNGMTAKAGTAAVTKTIGIKWVLIAIAGLTVVGAGTGTALFMNRLNKPAPIVEEASTEGTTESEEQKPVEITNEALNPDESEEADVDIRTTLQKQLNEFKKTNEELQINEYNTEEYDSDLFDNNTPVSSPQTSFSEESMIKIFNIINEIEKTAEPHIDKNGYVINGDSLSLIDAIEKKAQEYTDTDSDTYISSINRQENGVYIEFNNQYKYAYSPRIPGKKEGYIDPNSEINIWTFEPFSDSTLNNSLISDVYDTSAETISETADYIGFNQNLDSANVTLDTINSLSPCQIILWNGHGSYFNKCGPVLCLTESMTIEKAISLSQKIKDGEIIHFNDNGIGITAKYIQNNVDSMDNSFVYLGACYSAKDNSLAKAFSQKGAKAIWGYTDSVSVVYDDKVLSAITECIVDKNTDNSFKNMGEIIDHVNKSVGGRDPNSSNSNPTYLSFFGDKDFNFNIRNGLSGAYYASMNTDEENTITKASIDTETMQLALEGELKSIDQSMEDLFFENEIQFPISKLHVYAYPGDAENVEVPVDIDIFNSIFGVDRWMQGGFVVYFDNGYVTDIQVFGCE